MPKPHAPANSETTTSKSRTALITGATAGIGAAFADRLASEGLDLVLVARDAERLDAKSKELHERHGVEVETMVADLSADEGTTAVEKRLTDPTRKIDLLVNNAGFGLHGRFLENPIERHMQMLELNAGAVLRLTHAALGPMLERDSGGIINVSSVAAYTPGMRPSSTYAATKSFVSALTEGLAVSLRETGVRLSVVCPGFVRSEFHERAGIDMSKMPKFMWLDADHVVDTALRDHRAGHVISIPGAQYKILVAAVRLLPRSVVTFGSRVLGKRAN